MHTFCIILNFTTVINTFAILFSSTLSMRMNVCGLVHEVFSLHDFCISLAEDKFSRDY